MAASGGWWWCLLLLVVADYGAVCRREIGSRLLIAAIGPISGHSIRPPLLASHPARPCLHSARTLRAPGGARPSAAKFGVAETTSAFGST